MKTARPILNQGQPIAKSPVAGPFKRPYSQGLYNPQFEHDSCGVGFVVNIKGKKSHPIVKDALTVLLNLQHRGACGCEINTGDGAGILFQIPHEFLKKACAKEGFSIPSTKEYGVGMVFLPKEAAAQRKCQKRLEEIVNEEGQHFLGWRTVPTHDAHLGYTAKLGEPVLKQIFIGRNLKITDDLAFERKLYVIRKRAENEIRYSKTGGTDLFYIPSLSHRTIVYKGMLIADQIEPFYPDLADPSIESSLALVHSRFSTNTFPSWERAHPYRYIAHNGEINTLRGNINWMNARQSMLESDLFGDDLKKILPIVCADGSDSAIFDNVFEFLVLSGRTLPHAMMMMIPEPWSGHESMSEEKKAFYEYHSTLIEPWDGPASIAFTDGYIMGAVLDRNGLRPSRYYVTKDDRVIMASEVGVLEIAPENISKKGRLEPGRMLLIDTQQGCIVADEELKHKIAKEHPYRVWLNENLVKLESIPKPPSVNQPNHKTLLQRQLVFGYTFEELKILLSPIAKNGEEAIGSMGNDASLAVLSNKPRLLYDYFKQLFAQVTNPPIDAIREEIVTSAEATIGSEKNLLNPLPQSCHQIKFKTPILDNDELASLRLLKGYLGFKSADVPILFNLKEGASGLEKAIKDLCQKASDHIAQGANILILTDRGVNKNLAPIPALLAVAGLHHHLIREGTRTKVGLVLESGEPREVHHFALLIGYGAGAINPYLALDSLKDMIQEGLLEATHPKKATKNYVKAITKSIVKVISKMGISTIQSYRSAQIFEAVGLKQSVIDRYFTWTPSRIEGIGLEEITEEVRLRHLEAFPDHQAASETLSSGGQYQWRRDGEYHLFNPLTVHLLQKACRTNDSKIFSQYSEQINHQSRNICTLRGLFELVNAPQPIPLEEVESIESICKRFKTGAMSYGSISKEAHESLAIAMNRIGGKSNTGEGGEDPVRFIPDSNGDSRNSAIKQVASGRFGVTSHYLVNAKEIQIKMAQGAKPGEGGQLPGQKVYPWIAQVRHSTPGVGLISPPPHHDIYSIEDLAELIHDLKNANDQARITVKLVSEVGVGTIAAGVAKAHADVVLISGHDGGTGASPQTSIKHAGLPWELGLAETHQTLVLNNLRSRIVVETDGQLKTGRDVIIAALLGAEEFGFATAPLVVLGCVMMRVCHLDTCPVGVCTQNPELRKRFRGNPAHVVNFMRFIAQEVREIMSKLGFRNLNEMIGRSDKIQVRKPIDHWKAKGLNFAPILYQPDTSPEVGHFCQSSQDHGIDQSLDRRTLLKICEPALKEAQPVKTTIPIRNVNRVVGTILGSEVTRRYGANGLPEDTIQLNFKGTAGQSFGAFIPKGVTLFLEGDSNDYLGKGLSGGKIIVYPPKESTFIAEENIIIGNVAFYGATSGEAYIRGIAGERFCVRNSGIKAVVEAIGDHGCEYMTGGKVVILGPTGRNFAAGMSGGIAYVLDEKGDFKQRCNMGMVKLYSLEQEDEIQEVRKMIENHVFYTQSTKASRILSNWENIRSKFIKVYPKDYKRMIEALERVKQQGLTGEQAIMAAFEENKKSLVCVGE